MKYLLDTDSCIYIINRQPQAVRRRMAGLPIGAVGISSITYAELAYGANNNERAEANLARLDAVVASTEVLPFDAAAARKYGELRANLERLGQLIGPLDMLIAGHALALDLILVTNNGREFGRVPGLELENWI